MSSTLLSFQDPQRRSLIGSHTLRSCFDAMRTERPCHDAGENSIQCRTTMLATRTSTDLERKWCSYTNTDCEGSSSDVSSVKCQLVQS